jgi:hypothetical protein
MAVRRLPDVAPAGTRRAEPALCLTGYWRNCARPAGHGRVTTRPDT